jgi:hypothetical protein
LLVTELPAQQLVFALHESLCSRQIAPAGEHALPLLQRPTGLVPTFSQVTSERSPSGEPAEPQQSESAMQVSPVGLHPLGGWQISTPVGPNGKHARLQHSPPQIGSAPPT